MKVKILTLVALVVTVLSLSGCNREDMEHVEKTISEVSFGDTIQEVKEKRGEPQIEQDNRLVYPDKFGEYDSLVMYVFNEDGQLKDYLINFTETYQTKEEAHKRFKVLQIALTSLYGEGNVTKEGSFIWKDKDGVSILLGRSGDSTYILYSNKDYQ